MAEAGGDFAPRAWLELALVPRVSLDAKLAWLNAFGSPRAVLHQSVGRLREVHEDARPLAGVVATATIDSIEAWVKRTGGQCLYIGDDGYPRSLMDRISDIPLVLFIRGDPELLARPSVALLGGPRPSARGTERARSFARELAEDGVAVLAGISPGIGQAAHAGTLTVQGKPVGVIGDARNWEGVRLAEEVGSKGLLLSELAPGMDAGKAGYARRLRMLVGLATVAVVVEAPRNCDTLRLATIAGDMGCDVAAIPADPADEAARGNNNLLRDGATLVETSGDIATLLAGAGD